MPGNENDDDGPTGTQSGPAASAGGAPPEGRKRRLNRRWIIGGSTAVVLLLVAGGLFAWSRVHSFLNPKYKTVNYTVPDAPRLVAEPGQTVYRIDPTQSQLRYEVAEKIVGRESGHATGTTNGIAGDLAVDPAHPATSKVGDVVVNLEQLHSNENLRDARIRQDFLESHKYPLATFHTDQITGLPASLEEDHTYTFQLHGTAKVKETTAPVTWEAQGKLTDGQLTATATTQIKLSTFDAGPISIAGLVSTSDDAKLTLTVTAVDPSKHDVPTQISAPGGTKSSGGGPEFSKTIQPILEQNCASCHNAGKVGAEHWTMDDAGDASHYASGIATVMQARYMPPWPASDVGVPLAHSARLDQKTIDEVVAWSRSGGKLDVAASTPLKPAPGAAGEQPRHDLVLHMPQPYTSPKSRPNDYRCFVLDPKLTKPMYLTGYEFLGDKLPEIHHAQVFQVPADQVASASEQAGKDGAPGWECYAGPGLSIRPSKLPSDKPAQPGAPKRHRGGGFTGQSGLIAGWVPGQTPVVYGHDAGVYLAPGDVLVLQIHYHHEDLPPMADQSGIALQLDPPSPQTKPIRIVNPLGPVEIPCMPGTNAPLCNREAALKDDAQLYGPIGAYAEPGLLALCGKTPEELTAGFNGVAHSSCDSKVPEDGTIIGVMGHMHTLGSTFRLTLDPGTPQQKILLDIPHWNFDWQMNYGLATPLHVKAGETVRMQCSWDRSLDPNRPPKYIVFAEGTEDEMCFSTYALIPDSTS